MATLNEKLIANMTEFLLCEEKEPTEEEMIKHRKNNPFPRLTVQKRKQRDKSFKWIITDQFSSVVSKEHKSLVYDGFNSGRTDEHMADTRFDSIEEVLQFAKEHLNIDF